LLRQDSMSACGQFPSRRKALCARDPNR
jgi:hypothetical protein